MKTKPEIHPKGWGREEWIYNGPEYCGKILIFEKGKICSFHVHALKKEHMYIESGKIKMLYSDDSDDLNDAKEIILEPGDVFFIPPGRRHRMIALEDTRMFEFSTEHFESDSIRIIKGD